MVTPACAGAKGDSNSSNSSLSFPASTAEKRLPQRAQRHGGCNVL
jgi:hypothetical protein